MAAEQGITPEMAEVAPEHDLSLIEPQAAVPCRGKACGILPPWKPQRTGETAELALAARYDGGGHQHEACLRRPAADTLLRLLPGFRKKSPDQRTIAAITAIMENPPQLLVAKLIRDERVEVSSPLLEDGTCRSPIRIWPMPLPRPSASSA
ncbi:MAG: hypothetical protein U1E15_09340 [Hyphomicrobiales bacterium]